MVAGKLKISVFKANSRGIARIAYLKTIKAKPFTLTVLPPWFSLCWIPHFKRTKFKMLNRLPSANPFAQDASPSAKRARLTTTAKSNADFMNPRKVSLLSNVPRVLVSRVLKSLINLTVHCVGAAADAEQ